MVSLRAIPSPHSIAVLLAEFALAFIRAVLAIYAHQPAQSARRSRSITHRRLGVRTSSSNLRAHNVCSSITAPLPRTLPLCGEFLFPGRPGATAAPSPSSLPPCRPAILSTTRTTFDNLTVARTQFLRLPQPERDMFTIACALHSDLPVRAEHDFHLTTQLHLRVRAPQTPI